jgi:uncharacterized protein involved in exopolysaccharide biosynthesis
VNFEFKGENPFADVRGASVWTGDTYIATQMDIMRSISVAQKVVDRLTQNERNHLIASLKAESTIIDKLIGAILGSIRSLFSSDEKRVSEGKASSKTQSSEALQVRSPYNWVARAIGNHLTVEPMFGSRIVNISYASTNPKIAALMANKFAEAYLIANLQMIIDPAQKTKVWFDEQLKSLRTNLQNAQSKLTAFQQKEGIIATDERIDTENKRLEVLSRNLIGAQTELRNAVTEQQQLKEIMRKGASLMTFPKVFNNPVIRNIKGDIRALEAKHVEMSSRLGKNHPQYKRLLQELSATRGRLDIEVKVITGGIYNDADLARDRTRDLSKALETQKRLVLDLKYEYDRIAVFAREVESAQKTYNAALEQLNLTSMRSMVDQTNVSIVDPASIPRQHTSPQVMTNFVIGGFGGLLLAIGITIFMEMVTRKVHSREDFMTEVRVPLLGHLKKA